MTVTRVLVLDDDADIANIVKSDIEAHLGDRVSVDAWVVFLLDRDQEMEKRSLRTTWNGRTIEGELTYVPFRRALAQIKSNPADLIVADMGLVKEPIHEMVEYAKHAAEGIGGTLGTQVAKVANGVRRNDVVIIPGMVLVNEFLDGNASGDVVFHSGYNVSAMKRVVEEHRRYYFHTETSEAVPGAIGEVLIWRSKAFRWETRTEDLVERLPPTLRDALRDSTGGEHNYVAHDPNRTFYWWMPDAPTYGDFGNLRVALGRGQFQVEVGRFTWERLKGYVKDRLTISGLLASLLELRPFVEALGSGCDTQTFRLAMQVNGMVVSTVKDLHDALQAFHNLSKPLGFVNAQEPTGIPKKLHRRHEASVALLVLALGGGSDVRIDVSWDRRGKAVLRGKGTLKGDPVPPIDELMKREGGNLRKTLEELIELGLHVIQRPSLGGPEGDMDGLCWYFVDLVNREVHFQLVLVKSWETDGGGL